MILTAEYVSPGHPDRLADGIVKDIVDEVVSLDPDALCGLECAVHTNKVFIDGRIAAGKEKPVIDIPRIEEIARNVYAKAGYGKDWYPNPSQLIIMTDICIERLSDDERALRSYSDDQNIVNGYALNSPETDYLPIAHYVALRIGESLASRRLALNEASKVAFGPDFKVLVELIQEGQTYAWRRLTLSIQHRGDDLFQNIYQTAFCEMNRILDALFSNHRLSTLRSIDKEHFYLNGAGDFVQGGPEGDNGLSGKKLCIDFYGPSIPIGGGAIWGKDPHKIDVCGALKARQIAIKLVKEHGFCSVFTALSWSPGEESPNLIEAYEIETSGRRTPIDESLLPPADTCSIHCINEDLKLSTRPLPAIPDSFVLSSAE